MKKGTVKRRLIMSELWKPDKCRYYEKVNSFHKTTLGKPAQWLIDAAASIGLDLSGFRHEIITGDFKRHVIKRHGNIALHGKATIMDADFMRLPDIIKAPSIAIIGAIRKSRRYIVYAKAEPGMTYIYFEQIFGSHRNRVLRGSTFYKVTRSLRPAAANPAPLLDS